MYRVDAGTLRGAASGADGVAAVMDHLRAELLRAMQLCGVASPQGATPDLVGI